MDAWIHTGCAQNTPVPLGAALPRDVHTHTQAMSLAIKSVINSFNHTETPRKVASDK